MGGRGRDAALPAGHRDPLRLPQLIWRWCYLAPGGVTAAAGGS